MNPKKKYIYLLMVVGAVGAFMVDRLFLSEPESASAVMSKTSSTINKQPDPKVSNSDDVQIDVVDDPSLDYLNKLPDISVIRDVFSPTEVMRRHYKQLKEEAEKNHEATSGPKPGSPEALMTNNTLQATFFSNGTSMAVINDNVYRVGDTIDEFRITRIESYEVELHKGKDKVLLSLPIPTN
ncbi:MAG: hypothetical protein JSV03_08900 [Planctomycetota bacterium]|nr:MAG: hypothetical protein JSV03_08900 [Planctomycetota bacterium]